MHMHLSNILSTFLGLLSTAFVKYFFRNGGNKAHLRDLIAATDLVILLKLASNRMFFSQCGLEI